MHYSNHFFCLSIRLFFYIFFYFFSFLFVFILCVFRHFFNSFIKFVCFFFAIVIIEFIESVLLCLLKQFPPFFFGCLSSNVFVQLVRAIRLFNSLLLKRIRLIIFSFCEKTFLSCLISFRLDFFKKNYRRKQCRFFI